MPPADTHSSAPPKAYGRQNTHERPQQERLHQTLGGTMILEYRAVNTSSTCEHRDIDSVILPNTPHLTINNDNYNIAVWGDLGNHQERVQRLMRAEPVICVQAKNSRLGPYLLGQALFSRGLLNQQGITVARSIALCGGDEPKLSAIAREEYGLEVIIDPLVTNGKEKPGQLDKNPAAAEAYWKSVGGAYYPEFPLLNAGSRAPTFVDGIILPGPTHKHEPRTRVDLRGKEVTIVVSALRRACMYSLGMAVFARALAERAGAQAKAVLVARDHDSALSPLLKNHPHVTVTTPHELTTRTR